MAVTGRVTAELCMAGFVRVAAVSELPRDTGKVVELAGQEIALFRVGDEVCAVDNMCPHREGPLGEGELDGEVVTCPFHGWEVNVRSGEVVYNPCVKARTFACKVEGEDVLVEV
jgi:nitrite reductase/ring-hydroxylating ferredoxin subunit